MLPTRIGHLGKRTFLHPVVMAAAVMPGKVEGWQGAAQTIYTDHFLDVDPIDGPIGYKLEAPPLHPVIFASTVAGGMHRACSAVASVPTDTRVACVAARRFP